MGFYSRFLFPHLCDHLMGQPFLAEERKKVLADVGGDILEIGFGTGLNLTHYPKRVREITVVDPNPGMNKLARRRIAASGIQVHTHQLGGEALPFEAETFDCVVSTWTMCSIPEVGRALAEVYRVLKPGGRLVFLEHGLSDDPGVSKWQRRLNPIEGILGDGCRLDLDIEAIVRRQPFGQVEVERFPIDRLPRTHGTMYRGSAVKSSGSMGRNKPTA
jgi:SAM-dependent methyltransferase